MRILEATISKSVKKSDGNYGSTETFAALKAHVETGDDPDQVFRYLQVRVDQALAPTSQSSSSPPDGPDALMSVVVRGDTYPHKDALKDFGLRWNGLKGPVSAYEGRVKPSVVDRLRRLDNIQVEAS